MKKFMKIPVLLIFSFLVIFVFTRCEPEVNEMIHIQATLKNKSADNVHMWIQGETIGSLNKLGPNGYRTASTIIYGNGNKWTVKIYAGRDGETLDTYTYAGSGYSSTISIIFTSGGVLDEGI